MTSQLRQLQADFLPALAKLITFAYAQGFTMKLGDGLRTPEQAALNAEHHIGIAQSLHLESLAIDLPLYRGLDDYLKKTEDYKPLGDFWKTLHPNARWGGDIVHPQPDGNHFSFSYDHRI